MAPSARPEYRIALLLYLAAAVLLVAVGRDQWFFGDEWDFIATRELSSLDDLLRPHNEHWSTIPIVIWRGLLLVFGTTSYLPYLAVLAGFHVALAMLIYALLVRHHAPPLLALLAGLAMVLFGPGWENLLWAFQIGFVGSIVMLLAAVLVLEGDRRHRDRIAAGLLVASAMFSGLGIAVAVSVGVALAFRSQWHRALVVAGPAIVAQGVWLLWYREHVLGAHDTDVAGALALLPRYVMVGLSWAATGLSPLGGREVGVVLVVILLGLLIVRANIVPRPLPLAVPVLLLAVFGVFIIAGLGRAGQFGISQAQASRYAHIGAALLVPTIGVAAFSAEWVRKRSTPRGHAVVAACMAVVIVVNFSLLQNEAAAFVGLVDADRTALEAAARVLAETEPADWAPDARPIPRNSEITPRELAELMDGGLWLPDPSWPVDSLDLADASDRLVGLPAAG